MPTARRFQSASIPGYLSQALYGAAFTILGPILPELHDTLKVSLSTLGALFTGVLIGFVAMSLLSGAMTERYGYKVSLIFGSMCMFVGLGLISLSRGYPLLFFSAIIFGAGGGTLEPQAAALLSLMNPGREGFVVNMTQVFFGAGAVIGPIIARLSISMGSWRIGYFATSAASLLLAVGFLISDISKEAGRSEKGVRKDETQSSSTQKLSDIIKSRPFIALFLAMCLYTGSEIGFWGWLPSYLEKDLKADPGLAGLSSSIFWTVFICGRFLAGWLTGKVGELPLLYVSSALTAVSLPLFTFAGSPGAAMAGSAAVALCMSGIWPTIVAYGGIRFQSKASAVMGIIIAAGGMGGAALPPLLGLLAETAGLKAGFALLSVPALAMLAALRLAGRNG